MWQRGFLRSFQRCPLKYVTCYIFSSSLLLLQSGLCTLCILNIQQRWVVSEVDVSRYGSWPVLDDMTLNLAIDTVPGRLIDTLEGGRGCMSAFTLIWDFGDTEDPDFNDLISGMDLECGANLSSGSFCVWSAPLTTLTTLRTLANPVLAYVAQPLAELFLSHTPTNVLRVEASNLHGEHKRLKRPNAGRLWFGAYCDTILVARVEDVLWLDTWKLVGITIAVLFRCEHRNIFLMRITINQQHQPWRTTFNTPTLRWQVSWCSYLNWSYQKYVVAM